MTVTNSFATWLMSQTRITRYLVIALMIHAGLLILLGMHELAPKISLNSPFPLIPITEPSTPSTDQTVVDADTVDHGSTIKDAENGGDGNKGPGGIRNAIAGMPDSDKNRIIGPLTSTPKFNDGSKVIGPDSADGFFKHATGFGSDPAGTSFGKDKFGIPGYPGEGGILDRRQGPKPVGPGEQAVLAGLRWLKDHQQADGSWQLSQSVPAATGLAVLCFLGHGEVPESTNEFAITVHKGLTYLASTLPSDGIVPGANMYAQGIVTLALAEGYAMTGAPSLLNPTERAVKVILNAQKSAKTNPAHAGAWRYSPNSADSDVSVAGWQIMALKSAKIAGLDVPPEAFDKASDYLWRMFNGTGFGYDNAGAGLATTGVGTLCQQFLGHSSDQRLQKALEYIRQQKVEWDKTEGWALYSWYYNTQAMYHSGSPNWDNWEPQFLNTLVKNQTADGHWDVPLKSGETKEPVYATTMCVLMLEVYYRYSPIHKMKQSGAQSAPAAQTVRVAIK